MELGSGGSLQHHPGIVGQGPELGIELSPQFVGSMMPGPTQVQGQREQGLDAGDLSRQVIMRRGTHVLSPGGDFGVLEKIRARVWRAIIRSSLVGMTRTVHKLCGVLIGSACSAFRCGSRWMLRYSKPRQTSQRTGAARSPIPPVNTKVSRPPSTAVSAPMCLRRW